MCRLKPVCFLHAPTNVRSFTSARDTAGRCTNRACCAQEDAARDAGLLAARDGRGRDPALEFLSLWLPCGMYTEAEDGYQKEKRISSTTCRRCSEQPANLADSLTQQHRQSQHRSLGVCMPSWYDRALLCGSRLPVQRL